LKNPKKWPIICFASDKKESTALSESAVHWYFYVLERERERERKRERKIDRERERARAREM
jgi:hypothetical protein